MLIALLAILSVDLIVIVIFAATVLDQKSGAQYPNIKTGDEFTGYA